MLDRGTNLGAIMTIDDKVALTIGRLFLENAKLEMTVESMKAQVIEANEKVERMRNPRVRNPDEANQEVVN